MRRLDRMVRDVDPALKGKTPTRDQFGTLIDEDCDLYIGDRMIVSYRILPKDVIEPMRRVSLASKMAKTKRMNGTPTQSAVYGVMPRSEGRGMEYCRFTRASHEQKNHLSIIRDFNEVLTGIYQAGFPDEYAKAMAKMTEIHDDWKWMNGPFLTCNFNVNYAIPYHYDAANMKDSLSNVLILKNRVAGGELVCPEVDVTFSQRDGALILFYGGQILHGVMPIKETPGVGEVYRSSVVYYTLGKCKHCLSRADENYRARMRYDQNMRKDQSVRIAEKKAQLESLRKKQT